MYVMYIIYLPAIQSTSPNLIYLSHLHSFQGDLTVVQHVWTCSQCLQSLVELESWHQIQSQDSVVRIKQRNRSWVTFYVSMRPFICISNLKQQETANLKHACNILLFSNYNFRILKKWLLVIFYNYNFLLNCNVITHYYEIPKMCVWFFFNFSPLMY